MSFDPDTTCRCDVRTATNHGDRAGCAKPSLLILHYTGMESADAALDWLCTRESGVSCHYFVFEDGRIVQLVPESRRAWHAGQSCWQGETDINSHSIGIEIANPGHDHGYVDFPKRQIAAVSELCRDIVSRNSILPRHVLAHSDVAPGRKKDPGEKFPWKELHMDGVGLFVEPAIVNERASLQRGQDGEPVAALQAMLGLYGYGVGLTGHFDEPTCDCIAAFQRHFRPARVDGVADSETLAILEALIAEIARVDDSSSV